MSAISQELRSELFEGLNQAKDDLNEALQHLMTSPNSSETAADIAELFEGIENKLINLREQLEDI